MQRAGGDPIFRDPDRPDMAVGGEFEPVDTNHTMVGLRISEWAPVVNNIIIVCAGDMDH